ncbi:glycogen synthase [Clostridia bacterium]|nr:glycogen synthase [Clostridia bacterium]
MKVLMVTPEAEPFAKTGGLGDVLGALPKALAAGGVETCVVMPKYQVIPEEYKVKMEFVGHIDVNLSWRVQYCGVFRLAIDKVTYYFIDNEYYFLGDSIYGDYDLERFAFFSKAALSILPLIDFFPDIIHCHDWQTGVIPAILDAQFRHDDRYKNIRTVYTIHNMRFQGVHNIDFINGLLDLPSSYYTNDRIGKHGDANFMKAGIVFANHITTVSPTYSEEIRRPQYGEGLDWLLNSKADSNQLKGILNGIDYDIYSPSNTPHIEHKYDKETFVEGKAENKKLLQKRLNLPVRADVPIIAMVTRLTSQKGLDLVIHAMERLVKRDLQLVILGTGDAHYEGALRHFAYHHGDKVSANIMFSNELSHKIYAGSDMFLMPSLFEPCGLGQMIALSFGTLPIVRETGGLKDTVSSYNENTGKGNGFSFAPYNANDMIYTIDRALNIYKSPKLWQKITRSAMSCDYSWKNSAKHYIDIYNTIKPN